MIAQNLFNTRNYYLDFVSFMQLFKIVENLVQSDGTLHTNLQIKI